MPRVSEGKKTIYHAFSGLFRSHTSLQKRFASIENELETATRQRIAAQDELLGYTRAAREREDELILTFVEILNSKKSRIRELESRRINPENRDTVSSAVGAGISIPVSSFTNDKEKATKSLEMQQSKNTKETTPLRGKQTNTKGRAKLKMVVSNSDDSDD
jgi:hypothetical protein